MANWSSGPSTSRRPPRLGGGRYLVTAELGRGVSSDVYVAYDLKADRWCALKLLAMDYREDPGMLQRFAAEARALKKIKHKNVIRVYATHLDAFQPFISMELATGGCLMDWIKTRGPMPAQLAVEVISQICDGMGAAHAKGVIHRDLKPHNLLVNDAGQLKVTDFGVVSVDADGDHAALLNQAGADLGTLAFMPPEQRSDPDTVDHRADIYATVATFYTLLTGRTATELFMADMDAGLLKDVHDALKDVILKGAAYKPEDRYQSMRELKEELNSATLDITQAFSDLPSLVLGDPLELPNRPPERLAEGVRLAEIERALAIEGRARGGATPQPQRRGSEPAYLEEDESPTNPGGIGGAPMVIGVSGVEEIPKGGLPIQALVTPQPAARRDPTPKPPKPRTPTPAPMARVAAPPAEATPPAADQKYVVFEREDGRAPEKEPVKGLKSDGRIWTVVSLVFMFSSLLVLGVLFSFYAARHSILVAEAEYLAAERALHTAIRDQQFVVGELAPGMARVTLQEMYFEHDDAKGMAKLTQGIRLVNEVEAQYQFLDPRPSHHTDVGRAVAKLQDSRWQALLARQAWRESTFGVRQSVIVGLSLAAAPE